ncbi:MAG: MFS transporter, partial [Actinobacteria bacterium]|nr:MFS transporter [Actinomycetota bacterium]
RAQAALRQLNNPASVALLPRLVGADQLTAANAASSTSASLARLIGSPVGGLAVGLGGIGAVVVIDAVTFLAVAAATTLVRADTSPIVHHPGDADGAGGGAVTPGVRAGLRAITEHPRLRWLLIVNSLGQVSQGFFLVLFVVFVVDRLGGGGTEVGVIRGSMAVGALVGAAVIARTAHRCDPIVLLATGYVGMGVTAFAFWNAPSLTTTFWIYPLLFGLSGVPGSALSIGSFTAVQTFSPPGALGRVVGTAGALEAVTRALGSLLAGALVDERTLTALLDVQAAVYVGCGVLAVVTLRRLDSIHR